MQSAWVRIGEAVHNLIQPKINQARTDHVVNLLETFETDIGPHLAPIIRPIIADPNTPPELRGLLSQAISEEHFGGSVVVGIAIGAILSPVLSAAIAPTIQAIANATWHSAATTPGSPATVPLSPAEAAAGVVKGLFTVPQIAGEVAKSGVSEATFQIMTDVYGRSFGFEFALMLLRRGDITMDEFKRVIHYSDVRDDFIPDILKGLYLPWSVGEVINAYVKDHIQQPEAATRLGHAGIDPADLEKLRASAGRPIAIGEMFTVMHRGGAVLADVQQALRQSDINNDYERFLPFLQWHYPALFQIERAIKAGSMTPARARVVLGYEGYEPQDIDAVITASESTSTATVHELTIAQILRMLETHLITEAEAVTRIERHKFDAGTAALVIELAAKLREEKLLNAAITKVGTLYVGRRIDKTRATTELATAGVPATSIALYFQYWDIERDANLHVPSVPAIVGAYVRGVIDQNETHRRLLVAGVETADMAIIVAEGFPRTDFSASKAPATMLKIEAVVNPEVIGPLI